MRTDAPPVEAGAGVSAPPRAGVISPISPMLRQAEREARVWARMWRTSLLNGAVTPLLFLGAMGLGLGGLVDDNSGGVDGLRYLVFVAPGILAGASMQSAASMSLWPVMAGVKWTQTFHAAAATPLRPSDVYAGYVIWAGVRLTINAVAFAIVAALLGAIPSAWGVLAVPAAVAGGLALAAPLTAFSASRETDVTFPLIIRLGVMPMFLFSGTFFPLDQLPAGLEPLAWVTPLWHAVELSRGATTGSLELLPGLGHAAFLVGCVAVGAWWGAHVFSRRLAP
jgi:lipooligosaccharide transport system permease protein